MQGHAPLGTPVPRGPPTPPQRCAPLEPTAWVMQGCAHPVRLAGLGRRRVWWTRGAVDLVHQGTPAQPPPPSPPLLCALPGGSALGASVGATSSQCDGACAAGYACPPGSVNATAVVCGLGTYSVGGVSVCLLCPVGVYGASSGSTSPGCSGPCAPGYYCPPGSTNATASLCPVGTYSSSVTCVACPPGTYGSAEGASSPACTGFQPRCFQWTAGFLLPASNGTGPA